MAKNKGAAPKCGSRSPCGKTCERMAGHENGGGGRLCSGGTPPRQWMKPAPPEADDATCKTCGGVLGSWHRGCTDEDRAAY